MTVGGGFLRFRLLAPGGKLATYAFELISPDQASAFGVSDMLVIVGASASNATLISVSFAGSTVTLGYLERTLTFGPGFASQVHQIRPSSEPALVIGSTGDDALTGRDSPPGLFLPGGEPVGDALFGGPGADTINSGNGQDTVSGGSGADLFVFNTGQTGTGEVVTDFETIDRIAFDVVPTGLTYFEGTAGSVNSANTAAQNEIMANRADVVAMQVGPDVYIYADGAGRNLFTNVVILKRTALSQLDLSTFVQAPAVRAPAPATPGFVDAPPPLDTTPGPKAPDAPEIIGFVRAVGTVSGNMDNIHFGQLRGATIRDRTDADLRLIGTDVDMRLHGSVLVYDGGQQLIEGQAHSLTFTSTGPAPVSLSIVINGLGQRVTAFTHWVDNDASSEALAAFLSGNDSLTGSAGADLIRTYDGRDVVIAGGRDTVDTGRGDDVIHVRPGDVEGGTYLRGGEGNDWIAGGPGFDDINGNQANDTASGGDGNDWVVGGMAMDLLFGDAGDDLVYGNLHHDTCDGGAGADIVRGGQGNDVISGGSGNDYMSGDRGNDTIAGGSGADIFHTFSEAELDVVTDFIYGEGDRVQLDPGTTYTAEQMGFDVVISMNNGGRMILQNVLLSTLGPGWIYGG